MSIVLPARRRLASLRWRFAVALSGAVLACTAVCVLAAVLFLSQALTDRERSDLRHTLSGVSGYVDNQRHDLLGIADLVASDPAVRTDTMTGNTQAMVVHLTPIYADLNADVIDVINARGTVLVRMENTLVNGDSVRSRPSIRKALAGHGVIALERDLAGRETAGGYALRAVVPIRLGHRVVGAVEVGRLVDPVFAERIGHSLNANVNLIAGNQLTGTTLRDRQGLPITGLPVQPSVLARIRTGKVSIASVQEDGVPVLSGLVPLRGASGQWVGAVEVVRPVNPLYDLIRELSLLMLALGILVVVLGVLLALGISRRLTFRLSLLDAVVSRIAEMAKGGEPLRDIHIEPSVTGDDEVASLARSFSSMMTALDERMTANAELYAGSQARVRELSGLAEIARLLTNVSSVRITMDVLSQHVCRLVGVDAVAIWLPGEGSQPALHGGHGLPHDYERLSTGIAQEEGAGFETAAQAVLRTGVVEFRNLRQETVSGGVSQAALLAEMHELGWIWATAVPLRIKSRIVGAMTCYTRSTDRLQDAELGLLTTIADQVAVAVENARLATEAQRRAALEERLQAQEVLEQRVAERTRELTTLLDVSSNVASTLELEPLLGVILDQLKAVADSDGAAILTLQGDDLIVLGRRTPGPANSPLPDRYSAAAHGSIWQALTRGEAVIINNIYADDLHARTYRALVSDYLESGLRYEQSFMAVPMMLKDRPVGLVSLSSSRPDYFTRHHAALTGAIAQQAAVAIENARLYEQAQEVAVLEERQRLARELHDSVSQALFAVALGARTARSLVERDPSGAVEPLDYVLSQAEAGLTEMRALIFELRPQALDDEGLVAALRRQIEAMQVRHQIDVTASLGPEPNVPFAVKEAVYRIAQEALHNTVKHARAMSVEIRLTLDAEALVLDISDDGAGFDATASFPGHLGLRTMRERTLRFGGSLKVTSAPGKGTRIRAVVPSRANEPELNPAAPVSIN
jgi:signal transduction histidine kinase